LEVGLDVNGRFDLEALDTLRLYGREEAEVEQASIEDAHRTDTGIYASTEFMLGSKVTGGAGLRFDHVTTGNRGGFFGDQETSNDSLSGFASLQVELASRLSLTGQVSRGFRDPFLSDRYFFGVSGRGLVTGNPALDPETSLQFDLAVRSARSRLRWAVYAYRYRIDDLIERFELGDGLFFFRNRGEALLRGVELEVVGELVSGLTLQVGAQAESGEAVDDDTPLDDIPPERITAQLRKQIGEGNYALVQAALVARDDDPGPTETETPGYVLVDLGGGWRLSSWGSLRAWVRNVFDKAYPVSADRQAVLAPGISIVVTFVAGF
jgi:iron complex outermembrane receptor protein